MSGPGHNSVEQLRSIIDRVLRLKEEQDAIGEDVREVYVEAKSNGYDKTALGQVVSTIRKRKKDPQRASELDSLTALYLDAYDGGTKVAEIERAHTHAREDAARTALVRAFNDWTPGGGIPKDIDPATGEVIEEAPPSREVKSGLSAIDPTAGNDGDGDGAEDGLTPPRTEALSPTTSVPLAQAGYAPSADDWQCLPPPDFLLRRAP